MPASRNGARSSRTEIHHRGRRGTQGLAWVSAIIVLLSSSSVGVARAHPLAPALLELREVTPGQFEVEFKISALQAPGSEPAPLLPSGCRASSQPTASMDNDALIQRWRVACGGSLVGQRVGIGGLAVARIDGLVRVALGDGRVVQGVVRGDSPYFTVPARATASAIARDYARLGLAQLFSGLDHLCFVAGLLLLARTRRLTIESLVAFLVGSSLTLSLAAFQSLRLPREAIDLAVAFTVFWLAVELAREQPPRPTLLHRRPYLIAGGFGLVHGLGFAAGLQAIGLPSGDIPLAVAAFNLGTATALLTFVAGWLLLVATTRIVSWPRWAHQVPLYTLGTLGAFWCFQRAAVLLR